MRCERVRPGNRIATFRDRAVAASVGMGLLEPRMQLHDALGNEARAAQWRLKLEAEKATQKK